MEPKLLSRALIRRCHDYVLQVFMLQEKYPLASVLHRHCQCMLCLVGGGGGKVKQDTLREGAAVVTPDKVRWGQTKLFT